MTEELLRAHPDGRGRRRHRPSVGLLRPRRDPLALGERVFGTAVTGQTAQVMGDPDTLHSYSYTPDVAAGPHPLALHPAASGSSGTAGRRGPDHPRPGRPGLPARRAATAAARRGRTTLRCSGSSSRLRRIPPHALPVHRPLGIDDRNFRTAFGDPATPLDDGARRHLRMVPRPGGPPPPYQSVFPRARAAPRAPRPPHRPNVRSRPAHSKDHRRTPPAQTPARLAAAGCRRGPLAIAGFTALGSIFEYPQILQEPTAEILDLYRRHQGAVTAGSRRW